MRTSNNHFIDALIDPIPVFGPVLADLFYIWSGLTDAMNLRRQNDDIAPLPPGDNVVRLPSMPVAPTIRKAA